MTANGYGALAVGNIVLCVTLMVILFVPAAFGGFNSFAVAMYLALFTSMAVSFYLLAQRRELAPKRLRQVATVAGLALLLAISPILIN